MNDHKTLAPLLTEPATTPTTLTQSNPRNIRNRTWRIWIMLFAAFAIGLIMTLDPRTWPASTGDSLEQCAWHTLKDHVSVLTVDPIQRPEFLQRQATLAQVLMDEGADAFVTEASPSSAYYANVSATLAKSERPFLMMIAKDGNFSYLVPSFEAGRISGLSMVYKGVSVISWAEEEDPYQVFADGSGFRKVVLDEQARFMIATGLRDAGVEVIPMSSKIRRLREVKTLAELEILKAINVYTIEVIRALQKCIRPGVTQDQASHALQVLFDQAGVGAELGALVLFGNQAAYPHGGQPNKVLAGDEFVLLDVGSKLHGYGSDVTRTFLPNGSKVSKDLMDVWNIVHRAQTAAIAHMIANETCSNVDESSRVVIRAAGFADFYTHRLGHGLGLEIHEHPYLNGANHERLHIGEVMTNEPGIYVTDEQAFKMGKKVGFGVRIEDPILVTESGGIPLTNHRAQSPYHP